MNNKSKLNTYCQKTHKAVPCYSSEKKGDVFVSTVIVEEATFRSIHGHSTKKEAENDAAGVAIQEIVQSLPANKSIDELIEGIPTSKNKKKAKQQKPDTQQLEHPGPEFTPISAVSQTQPNQGVIQPTLIRTPASLSSADPRLMNRPFSVPAQPQQIPPPLHQPPPGPVYHPCPPQQPFSQPPPHPLFSGGQVPVMRPVRPPTRPPQSQVPVSIPHPGTAMLVQPPPRYVLPPATAYKGPVPLQPSSNLGIPFSAIPTPIRSPTPDPGTFNPGNNQTLQSQAPLSEHSNVIVGKGKAEKTDIYTVSLKEYCRKRGIPKPIYSVREESGKFSARVVIDKETFSTEGDFNSFVSAQENVTLKALATVGMRALNLGSPNSSTLEASRGSSIVTRATDSLSDVSSNSQASSLRSSQLNTVPHSVELSQEKTPAPLDLEDKPLKPPSFFTEGTLSHASQNPPTSIPGPDSPTVSIVKKGMEGNHKATLNTYCQKNHLEFLYDCTYPEDAVGYIATVTVRGMKFTSTPHGTKRAAEDHAAEQAVAYLGAYREMNKSTYPVPHPVSTTDSAPPNISSFKNLLQEHCQKHKLRLPHYEAERTDEGFKSTVRVHPTPDSTAEFTSSAQPVKKAAEQEAARLACEGLKIL